MHVDTLGGKNPLGMQKMFVALDDSVEAVSLFEDLKCLVFTNINDCAIYTCQDEEESIDNIAFMQVAVYILTPSLLMAHNMFIDSVLPACFEHKIPVLPLLIENRYEKQYTYHFDTIQYLCPFDNDYTKIPFEKRLISRLLSILASDSLSKQIRHSFPVSLFLSYRQKNRDLANKLMSKIHEDHRLLNVAIWYDERIAVGESFSEEIYNAIRQADGFVLLVTSALLEMPNYVYDTEYKTALSIEGLKERIIAIHLKEEEGQEKCELDSFLLLFNTIQHVYSDGNIEEMYRKLLEILNPPIINDAATLYFVGLGYQNGISVETNSSIAVELLKRSAESGYRSAIDRLVVTYSEGIGVERSYDKSIAWQKKLIETVVSDKLSEEYQKLADLYTAKHDWDEAIKYRQIAVELLPEDDNGKKIETFVLMIRDALRKNNAEGFKTALVTCCQGLRLITDMLDSGCEPDTLESLQLFLSQLIRVLFMLNNSKRFQEQVRLVADQAYIMKNALLKFPELGIRESLCNSAFHEYFAKQAIHFFYETGIAEKKETEIDYDASFEYTDPALLAEELSYINLNLEFKFMKDDFSRHYIQTVQTLFATIDFYLKSDLFAFAKRNLQLVEKILEVAKIEWYTENREISLELEAKKLHLLFTTKDKSAVSEWELFLDMIKAGSEGHPESLLKGYEIIEDLMCVIDSDTQACELLFAQEGILNRIPDKLYNQQEVDRMLLHNSVNLYIYLFMNNDSRYFLYYNQSMKLCKKLHEKEKDEVFHALQSMYLIRLGYAAPESLEECDKIDTIIEALMNNLEVYLDNGGSDMDSELRRVLYEADQYLNWLKENHPEHASTTAKILLGYLEGRFEQYVNSIMIDNPALFLPPSIRFEFSDFEMMKGMNLQFLQTFRTVFFSVHSFMITNASERMDKIKALDKAISIYKEVIYRQSQGFIFQVLNNELNLLENYQDKLSSKLGRTRLE